MTPDPNWRSNLTDPNRRSNTYDDLVRYVRPKDTFNDLWESIKFPEWLIYLAEAGGASKANLVMLGCDVARLCIPLIPEGIDRNLARKVIETSELWCAGEATVSQVSKTQREINSIASVAQTNAVAYFAIYYVPTAIISSFSYTGYIAGEFSHAKRAGIDASVLCAVVRKFFGY